jgi:uncharacterized protein YjbJ (UPF0337 family)
LSCRKGFFSETGLPVYDVLGNLEGIKKAWFFKAPALPIEVLPSHRRVNAISSKGGRGERRKSVAEQEPGAAQKAKGLAKEAAGTVMGDEEMKAEGRAEREGSEEPAEREGTEGHKEYFRKIIEETNKRSSGKA